MTIAQLGLGINGSAEGDQVHAEAAPESLRGATEQENAGERHIPILGEEVQSTQRPTRIGGDPPGPPLEERADRSLVKIVTA
ncbi:MAG: hypothetical protein ACRDZO_18910 [Egibacteraceae bacterium]